MGQSWLPTKDGLLQVFCTDFSTLITASPTSYGLISADATALAALVASYTSNLATATNLSTRTPVAIALKNSAKAALIADMRALARRIQINTSVTPAQKTALGLPVHDSHPTPVPTPATKPILSVVATGGSQALIRLVDESTPTKRARPVGTEGAIMLSYVPAASEAPPIDLSKWSFSGIAKREDITLDFDGTLIGKTAYIKAFWFNPRGQTGPASDTVATTIAA